MSNPSVADPRGTGTRGSVNRLVADRALELQPALQRFHKDQIVALKIPVLRMATELGGSTLAALLREGDLLKLNEPHPWGSGKVYYAMVLQSRDNNSIGRLGIVRTEWIRPTLTLEVATGGGTPYPLQTAPLRESTPASDAAAKIVRPHPFSPALPRIPVVPPGGYAYKTKHYIGKVTEFMDERAAMGFMKRNPNKIFPFSVVMLDGSDTVEIINGARLDLQNLRYLGDNGNYVVVENVTETQFTFRTLKGHFDGPDALISFRTYKEHGKLYLEQSAWAPKAGQVNAVVAPWGATKITWPKQAENLRNEISKIDPIQRLRGY